MGRVLPARWYRKRAQLHFNLLYGSVDIYSQKELYEKYKKNEKSYQIIGITSATLIDKCRDANALTKDDLTHTIFDTTTRKDSARILLTNSTGATRYLSGCMIHGKLIKRFSDKDGFIHDSFVDYESIRKNGERKLEIGNNFICLKEQVEKIADYHAKFNRGPKHIYSLTLKGTRHYYEPGEWYTLNLNITTAGIDELMNMKCRCMSVSIERSGDGLGTTEIILEEIIENWTFDSNSVARFLLSGNLSKLPIKEKIIVAASDYDGVADYYCDGTADEVEVNKAIVFVAGRGGGIVERTEGTFVLAAAIELKSNIIFQGRGANTITEKNGNFRAIEAIGTSGTFLENIILRNFKVTRNSSDTNDIELVYFKYVKDSILNELNIEDGYEDGLVLEQTLRVMIVACLIAGNVIGCRLISDESTDVMDRGNCEDADNGPAISGENPSTITLTPSRSDTEIYKGSYSYDLVADEGEGGAYIFMDAIAWNDLHGATPGKTYTILFKYFIPSTDYPTDRIWMQMYYFMSETSWKYLQTTILESEYIKGQWQSWNMMITLPQNVTGFHIILYLRNIGSVADKHIYIDECYLYEYDLENNGYLIHGCKIKENTKQGLFVSTNQAQIRNNTIDNNKGVGLEVFGDKNIVSNNVCSDNGNLIEDADCEKTSAPYIRNDGASDSNATVARSDTQEYEGSYSSKLTITATGSEGIGRLADNVTTTDMHELIAGLTYKLTAWVYVPSTGGPAAAEVKLRFSYYLGAAWVDKEVAATGQDAWEELDCGEVTIPATATGIKAERLIDGAASNGELCYFDNFRLQPIGIHNVHNQNFKDSGTGTMVG